MFSEECKLPEDRRQALRELGLLLGLAHEGGHLVLEVGDDVRVHFAQTHSLHQLVDLSHCTVAG